MIQNMFEFHPSATWFLQLKDTREQTLKPKKTAELQGR